MARAGFLVTLIEQCETFFDCSQSRFAGAMLSPYCEEEAGHPLVRDLGMDAIALWQEAYPGLVRNGTLVVAHARDQSELKRFGRVTSGYQRVDGGKIGELEPDLGWAVSRWALLSGMKRIW